QRRAAEADRRRGVARGEGNETRDLRGETWGSLRSTPATRNYAGYFMPLTGTMFNFADFSPSFSAALKSGELRHRCSASMLSHRRITTGPTGSFPASCVPGPAATYSPP